jgi:hypothetical protein
LNDLLHVPRLRFQSSQRFGYPAGPSMARRAERNSGAGVEEALRGFGGDLEAQTQRAQHADAAIAEIALSNTRLVLLSSARHVRG